MTEVEFLCPDRARAEAGFAPVFRSPLARALRHGTAAGLRDLSGLAKIEVRGELEDADVPEGAEAMRISARRTFLVCAYEDGARVREQLAAPWRLVIDQTGAMAGLALTGARLMRRLTDLDLDALPAAGAVAHAPAIVAWDDVADEGFRVFVPQELGHFVAEVVIDAAAGLAATR